MEFFKKLNTKYKSSGINTKEYIIVHHTGTPEGTITGNINYLTNSGKASVHYVVDINGDIYKIGSDDDIMRHAGNSKYEGKTNISNYSIGIEVIGPMTDGGFSEKQKKSVKELIQYLMKKYKISEKRVLRHKDIAFPSGRKTDIAPSFYKEYGSWEEYQKSLIFNQKNMGAYEKQYKAKYGNGTIYNDIEGALKKLNVDRELFFFLLIGMERIKNS